MREWIPVVAMLLMMLAVMALGLPSLLLWRDERREARKSQKDGGTGTAATSGHDLLRDPSRH
jgi:hypothetical protein